MKYALALLAFLAVSLLVLHLLGTRLPREHTASRSVFCPAAPDAVFKTITDVTGFTQWRPELKSAEKLEDVGGKRRFRETSGGDTLTFEVVEETPPVRLVTRIVDEGQPFGGRWTTELRPVGEGTEVRITEDGYVNPPIFRFLSRYVFGQTATMETYLKNLEKRFAPVAR